MHDSGKNEAQARKLSIIFVAATAAILLALVITILSVPYDPGVLMGTSLSGNNQNGGKVTTTKDYIFYLQNGSVMQYDRGKDTAASVYKKDNLSCLNPYDGWLYLIQDGRIARIAYYGGEPIFLGDCQTVKSMSVNGLWIYYTDAAGVLYKIRTDGEKQTALTDGKIPVAAFESANRIVVFTDGKKIYRMNTDGSGVETLVAEKSVDRMVYTLDQLFYLSDGEVKYIKSVESGADDGCGFTGMKADLFNYDTDSNGRGQIFYLQGDELHLRKLESIQDEKEEDRLLTKVEDMKDLYVIDGDVFFYNSKGELFRVFIDDSSCSVEAVK